MKIFLRVLVLAVVVSGLLLAGMSVYGAPVRNVSARLHPNLFAAQKAKDLLDQANAEIKLAAEAANANKDK
jgi:hypothetical protein